MPRPLLSALSCLAGACLVLAGALATAATATAADGAVPVLTGFTVSDRALTPGEATTIHYTAAEDSGSLAGITFTFVSGVQRFSSTSPSGQLPLSGEVRLSIPDGARNGLFTLNNVVLTDAAGNSATFGRTGLVTRTPSTASGPSTHTVAFSSGDVTLSGSVEDTTAPVVTSLATPDPTLTVGDTLVVGYAVTDEHDLTIVQVDYANSPYGYTARARASGTALPKAGSATVAVDNAWANGSYAVQRVVVADQFGNTAFYHPDGTLTYYGTVGPSAHDLDLGPLAVTATGSTADFDPPVLTSLGQPTSPVVVGGQVSLPYSVTDASGPVSVSAHFHGIDGQTRDFTLSQAGAPLTGVLHGAAGTDTSVQARGTYVLDWFRAEDSLGRWATYRADGTVVSSPGGPTTHSVSMTGHDVVLATTPDRATYVRAVPGDRTTTVRWEAYGDTGGTPVTKVVVTASPSGTVLSSSRTSGSVTFTGLTNRTAYTFTVKVVNGVGASPGVSAKAEPRPAGSRILGPGDFDDDGCADILAVTPAGKMYLYRGNGAGGITGTGRIIGAGWQSHRIVLPSKGPDEVGLMPDVWSVAYDGTLLSYAARDGGFSASWEMGHGWGIHDKVLTPGDFTGDLDPDLMAINDAGELFLYPYNGNYVYFDRPLRIGTGWDRFSQVFTMGDQTGDGHADVIGLRRSDGTLWLYPGNGRGGWAASGRKINAGWGSMRAVFSPGDFDGDRRNDLLAVDSSGRMHLYHGNSRGGLTHRGVIGAGWGMFS